MAKATKLSKLSHQITVEAYGVTLRLCAETRAVLKRFARFLPYGCHATNAQVVDRTYSVLDGDTGEWRLYANSRKVAQSQDSTELKRRLRAHAQLFIAATSEQYVFIHAGVVAWGDCAILIPGRSYSGKTTLVAEFVKAGATYYSDEYALLDQKGRVHPYPRPLSVRGKRTGIQRDVESERLGGQVGEKPLPVGLILLTKYQARAQWNPMPINRREASKGLALNAVAIRRFPATTLKVIALVSAQAAVLQGVRGEAQKLVESAQRFFSCGGSGWSD